MGYFFGKKFGHVRLVPYISPGKSVEGFIVNIVASTLPLLLLYYLKFSHGIGMELLPPMELKGYLAIGVWFGVVGPLGDLLESVSQPRSPLLSANSPHPDVSFLASLVSEKGCGSQGLGELFCRTRRYATFSPSSLSLSLSCGTSAVTCLFLLII